MRLELTPDAQATATAHVGATAAPGSRRHSLKADQVGGLLDFFSDCGLATAVDWRHRCAQRPRPWCRQRRFAGPCSPPAPSAVPAAAPCA